MDKKDLILGCEELGIDLSNYMQYLEILKIDKPIKFDEPYDAAEYLFYLQTKNEKYKIYEQKRYKWLDESRKALIHFYILIALCREDKKKVNDYIKNNMMNILDDETDIDKISIKELPIKEISPILYEQQEGEYISLEFQKKLVDFCVNYQDYKTENMLYVDYSEKLEDYIFEKHINLLHNANAWRVFEIVGRNIDKIEKFSTVQDIKDAEEIVEVALNYAETQYGYEVGRVAYDEKSFFKVKEIISQIRNEIPETRSYIQTLSQDQIINSAYLIHCKSKELKNQNKRLIDKFNSLIKDYLSDMFKWINEVNLLKSAKQKIRKKTLNVVYEEEMREIEEMVDSQYKKYVEEFHKSNSYSFDKYYAKVEEKLNSKKDFYKFVSGGNFSEVFGNIVQAYKSKEIKDLLASNEYYYDKLKDSVGGVELTPLMTCLIKAIEQFMCAVIKYAHSKGYTAINEIKEQKINYINWDECKITCNPLKCFIEDYILNNENNNINSKVNFKKEIVENLNNFILNVRNGHFHKHNIFDAYDVEEYINDSYSTIRGLIAMIIYLENN